MIWTLTQVAIGGAIGSALRFVVVAFFGAPLAVLAVNVVGSLVMGIAFVMLSARLSPLLMTGVLGGFTTFSAFSLETFNMINRGEIGLAAAYAVSSVAGSVLALMTGVYLATKILGRI